jgi:hypothetical protein
MSKHTRLVVGMTSVLLLAGCAEEAGLGVATQGVADSCAPTNPYDPIEADGYVIDYDAWFAGQNGCLAYETAPVADDALAYAAGLSPNGDGSYSTLRNFYDGSYGTAWEFANIMVTIDPALGSDMALLTNRLYVAIEQYKSDLINNRWGPTYCVDEYGYTVSCTGGSDPLPVARMMPDTQVDAQAWQGELPVIQGEVLSSPLPTIFIAYPRYSRPWYAGGNLSLGGGLSIGYVNTPTPVGMRTDFNNHGFGFTWRF